jgi:hypothetical protein
VVVIDGDRWAGWTLRCAAAEAIGMTAAAAAGTAAQHLVSGRPSDALRWGALALIVGGGLVEGIALGTLQAGGLRHVLGPVGRRRWVVVTVAVAGIGWAVASAPAAFASSGPDAGGPPVLLVELGAAGLGVVMGAVLGAAQATVLRGRAARPGRWVVGNVLAWPPVMMIIFAGATGPDSHTPALGAVAIGTLTGALAGTVLGIITARFRPRSPQPAMDERAAAGHPASR